MKKNKNKFAKVATVCGVCALGSLAANAFGVDVDVHANSEQGIGASVDADVGLARANVGANLDSRGVDAGVGADVVGVGANTAAHVGFDGVKARAHTYAWNVANVGANAGATWKDGVYVGGTARFCEPANTARVAIQGGQSIEIPAQRPPQGCAWVYGSNGRIVGYQPLPLRQRVAYAQPTTVVCAQPAPVAYAQQTRVVYAQPAQVVCAQPAYTVAQQPVQPAYAVAHTRPAEVVTAEREEIRFHHEHAEQTPNSSVYKRNDFHQINDPANGYRMTDQRQYIHTVTRQRMY